MSKISNKISTAFSVWMAKQLFRKLLRNYKSKYKTRLPVILITGTLGKSSTTLLLKSLFQQAQWQVITGASEKDNLNTAAGMAMLLSEVKNDLVGSNKYLHFILYFLKSLNKLFFGKFSLQENSIFVYELGFSKIGHGDTFGKIFGPNIDILVTTNCTLEHSMGYDKKFDTKAYNKIKSKLPVIWQQILEADIYEDVLKNTALEQFKLLQYSQNYVLPTNLGEIENSFITNLQSPEETVEVDVNRVKDFALEVEGKYITDKYLLPLTFAKNLIILEKIALKFGLNLDLVSNLSKDLGLPNGRFSLLKGINDTKIVDSTYNSDPSSLNGFLDLLIEVINFNLLNTGDFVTLPKHYLILGEMRELGKIATAEHCKVLDRLIEIYDENYIEDIYLLGREWLKCNQDSILKREGNISYIFYHGSFFKVFDKAGSINNNLSQDKVRPNSWLWIKGSQNTVFLEIVVQHLLTNKSDVDRLCRRGSGWEELRSKWK